MASSFEISAYVTPSESIGASISTFTADKSPRPIHYPCTSLSQSILHITLPFTAKWRFPPFLIIATGSQHSPQDLSRKRLPKIVEGNLTHDPSEMVCIRLILK
jgi:hypothetical protein